MNSRRQIVVRVDGGICSQISSVSMGMYLAEKFAGRAEVKYDLAWYRDCGVDMNGTFVRNWDFPKAFPGIACPEATDEESRRLSSRHPSRTADIDAFRPPVYVSGYPDRYPNLCAMAPRLRKAFAPQLDDVCERWLATIAERPTCAVHVRRGDLASFNPAYGNPASVEYFQKAIAIIHGLCPDVRFLFFSDERDWVRDVLLPALPAGTDAALADGHGSDGGYLDLYLISKCDYIVSSSGSFGVFGAVLSDSCRALVMSRNREYAFRYLKNVIYINDTYFEVGPRPSRRHGLAGLVDRLLGRHAEAGR